MICRYVGIKKGDLWVGTCLELGIVVVAENIDELKKEMWVASLLYLKEYVESYVKEENLQATKVKWYFIKRFLFEIGSRLGVKGRFCFWKTSHGLFLPKTIYSVKTTEKDNEMLELWKNKYRKKPIIVEAIRLGWDTWTEICDFVSKDYFGGGVYLDDTTFEVLPEGTTSYTIGLKIKTLEGEMLARQGDYVIKGINGEFYPCKPDIFKKTYEEVRRRPNPESPSLFYLREGEIFKN